MIRLSNFLGANSKISDGTITVSCNKQRKEECLLYCEDVYYSLNKFEYVKFNSNKLNSASILDLTKPQVWQLTYKDGKLVLFLIWYKTMEGKADIVGSVNKYYMRIAKLHF